MTQGQTLIEGLSDINSRIDENNIEDIKNRKPKIIYASDNDVEKHDSYFKN